MDSTFEPISPTLPDADSTVDVESSIGSTRISPTLALQGSSTYRSASAMLFNVEKCILAIKYAYSLGDSSQMKVTLDENLYKFTLDEKEYALDDSNQDADKSYGNFFLASDSNKRTIIDPEFYQKLLQKLPAINLRDAVLQDNINAVRFALENDVDPFSCTTTQDIIEGIQLTENEEIIDLIDSYKILWTASKMNLQDIKIIEKEEFVVFAQPDRKICLDAMQKIWFHAINTVDGKIDADKMMKIWPQKSANNILQKEEAEALLAAFNNDDFSSYDEIKLHEQCYYLEFEREIVNALSAVHNIFAAENREKFFDVVRDVEKNKDEADVAEKEPSGASASPKSVALRPINLENTLA